MEIRRLKIGEASLYRKVRLESLKESPDAFSSTYDSALQRSYDSWQDQADSTAIGSDRATFLVLDEGEPVGLAALYREEELPTEGELIQVWISPTLRGSHSAARLMDAIFAWADLNGINIINAEVISSNERALRFYRRYGFRDYKTSTCGEEKAIILRKLVEPARGPSMGDVKR